MIPDLAARLLAFADDEFLLGHRDSEWCGHAPILEEDIAFANIAQDEIGHAILWYEALQTLTGRLPNELTFFREAADWRNVQLVELPRGDWAFSMVRQYLFDAYEVTLLERLVDSSHAPIAAIAARMRPEEQYHYRHTSNWVRRLGLGTAESQARMQAALDRAWPCALQLFVPLKGDDELVKHGVMPHLSQVLQAWEKTAREWLAASGLSVPAAGPSPLARDRHTEHLVALLEEMQAVARTEAPDVEW